MYKKLENNIRVELIGCNKIVEDLDISVKIEKTNEAPVLYIAVFKNRNSSVKEPSLLTNSLYLVSGIPVVIWKEAAEAKFVEEHGLGITVNSLDELGEKFASLSEEEYFEMVKNVAVVSNRLKNGYYLTQAIKEIEEA